MSDVLYPYLSYVHINSINRSSGNSSNFTINIGDQLNQLLRDKFDRVVLLGCNIPKSYYTINSLNNTFTLIENGISSTITIDIGNYNYTSLATQLTTKLNAATQIAATYSITLLNSTGKYQFTTSSALSTSFSFVNKTIRFILGFDNTTYSFSSLTLTSVNILNLQKTSAIDIYSDIVADNNGLLSVIFPSSNDFSVISYINDHPGYNNRELIKSSFDTMTISLVDEYGNLLDLNGIDITCNLLFYKTNQYYAKKIVDDLLALDMTS